MPQYAVKLRRYFRASETTFIYIDADNAEQAKQLALESDPNKLDITWEDDYSDYEHEIDFDVEEVEEL